MKKNAPWMLLLAWLICLAALIISQYSNYALGYPTCILCWWQRIFMYPLVIILGIATFTMSNAVIPYIISFPLLGMITAAYQYMEQMIPGFSPIAVCGTDVQCSDIHLQWLGFITYPFLSFMSFLVIFICLLAAYPKK